MVEIANAAEVVQDGRIYIELVNSRFINDGGTPDQFRAGIGMVAPYYRSEEIGELLRGPLFGL